MDILKDRFPNIPDRIAGLGELTYNLWWSWHPEARMLFKMLDRQLWKESLHNPVKMLKDLPAEVLEPAANSPDYLRHYDDVLALFRHYVNTKGNWFRENFPDPGSEPIAYFSAEYGLQQAVAVMARITEVTEAHRSDQSVSEAFIAAVAGKGSSVEALIALSVHSVVERLTPTAVVTPTQSGATARSISRFRSPMWIVALSRNETTCRNLQFSYGVYPAQVTEHPASWEAYARDWLEQHGLAKGLALLTQGVSAPYTGGTNRLEIINFGLPCDETADE